MITNFLNTTTSTISHLFFPAKLPSSSDITFKDAVDAVKQQRIARITKAALFAISSVAATVTLVLTEGSLITWPIAISAILISLISGIAFYRLNSLDQRYLEGLDDKTRESLVKKELERILLSEPQPSHKEVTQSYRDINRLLGNEILDKETIESFENFCLKDNLNQTQKSLATLAFEQLKPIKFSSNVEWFEKGHYGLANYGYSVGVNWSGNPLEPMDVIYKRTEKTKEGQDIEQPVSSSPK